MASCLTPKRAKCSVRHHLQLSFPSQATKEALLARLDRAKQRMFPEGGTVDNYRLLTCLLDVLEGQAVEMSHRPKVSVHLRQLLIWIPQVGFASLFFLAVSLCLFYFHHH